MPRVPRRSSPKAGGSGHSQRQRRKSFPLSNLPDGVIAKLKSARVAHLATVRADGSPHIVPICFAYAGSLFYTAIDRKPKRIPPEKLARVRNIQANPSVALVLDHYSEDWKQLWHVLIRGKAKLLAHSSREHAKAVRLLRTKYPQYAAGMLSDDALIIRITIERVAFWSGRAEQ